MRHEAVGPTSRRKVAIGDLATDLAAPALILVAPFVGFLRVHHYEFLRPEVGVILATLVALGLILGAIVALRPEILRPLIFGILLTLFIDLIVPLEMSEMHRIRLWFLDAPLRFGLILCTIIALQVLFWPLRRALSRIATITFGVIILGTLLIPPEAPAIGETRNRTVAADPDLPPVVHLILDEHIGIEGLPADIPGARELQRDIKAFYKEFGFTLFGRAFSHYNFTTVSLSYMMNGGAASQAKSYVKRLAGNRLVHRNKWFEKLSERGYRIRVYQSDFLDFCTSKNTAVDFCFVYPANSIRALIGTEFPVGARIHLILSAYVGRSLIILPTAYIVAVAELQQLLRRLGFTPVSPFWEEISLAPIASLTTLDRLRADLRKTSRGTAFVAHLILPHGPFMYDADCQWSDTLVAWYDDDPRSRSDRTLSPERRKALYQNYFRQIRCTLRKIEGLLKALAEDSLYQKAIIIVHGDHGLRMKFALAPQETDDQVSDALLIENFSTLFAIKMPGLDAAYMRQPRSIQAIFADHVLGQPLPEEPTTVFLRSENDDEEVRMQPFPLPDSWK